MVGPSVQSKEDGGEELNPSVVGKPKGPLAAREEEVLEFWNRERIFEKSVEKPASKGEFVFYDGPPFANGLPHYGHLLASAIKDAIPRYRTMRGYRVERQWGWDCHGLPVENLVEKELDLRGGKRAIEDYGIAKFNEAARTSIMKDVADWKRIIPRMGRWADMERDYKTMDSSYTESVWWAFKTLYDKDLAYEGFKAMHYCPRCGTTLANFEVAQGYKDIDDIAVTVRLPLVDEPGTSLLIWTTTPWTLPGNAAAAVNEAETYVKVRSGEYAVIVAKALKHKVEGEVVEEIPGKKLVGKRYEPPFSYYKEELKGNKSAWKVYAAPYVTMEDGTGVVHLAPAFGAEDLELAQKVNIPLIHHVGEDGKFVAEVADFAGLSVKPKGNPRETDEKVAALLESKGLLFAKEKINHSYPHCWRCDTPLLNWAATSWFVNVGKIKAKLLEENGVIGWVPGHVGEGRFGKWLEGARDWAISRSRYWGAPLPVWRNGKEIRVVGSVADLLSIAKKSGNRYFVMRHVEAKSNVEKALDLDGDPENHITERGKEQARATAADLKKQKIDLIVVSPFLRAQETAKLVQSELGLPDAAVITDERLREFNGDDISVRRRMGECMFDLEQRYQGKNLLLISHGNPLWNLARVAQRLPHAPFTTENMMRNGEALELPFVPFPHNANYELDLHRPYIDDFDTGQWRRIKDVFDCWFESGSMPFASRGYPHMKSGFNPKGFLGFGTQGYPADFIAEGLDQTRGWFYSLIVLGVALFGKSPYRNVIVNGIITAADGQKMSKRLKNYPDPMEIVEKYGADSMRYFLLSSSVVRGEDLRFNERGVDEVQKKLLMRLDNVRSFLELYAGGEESSAPSCNVLDRWILSRLGELITLTTQGFERYELDVAARPLAQFIDDLSTWYLRRSRDRFKTEGEDKAQAMATLRRVLLDTAKAMAPIMPFFAEDLYRRLRREDDPQSVHLCSWPDTPAVDSTLIEGMQQIRALASEGLELRERTGMKLRQPLTRFSAKAVPQDESLRAVLREELNVKDVAENPSLESPELDTNITPELKEEGMFREWVRTIQDWRKEQKLSIADRPGLLIKTDADIEFLKKYKEALRDATGLLSLEVREDAGRVLERM